MFEKVNPAHPDKIADRIAGAIVDLAYKQEHDPKIAVEVLLGHDHCTIIIESTVSLSRFKIWDIVKRLAGDVDLDLVQVPQDKKLAANQDGQVCCGDNGIFRGMPVTDEQEMLSNIARDIYSRFPTDGKYMYHCGRLVLCQSNCDSKQLQKIHPDAVINPIGEWTGGINVDSGATNRKLGSDMGDSVTGGGLHGKDLSKADVSVNIYAFLKAQHLQQPVEFSCAIGDRDIDGKPYEEIIKVARNYIDTLGGFEKFAEWGLI